MKKTTFIIVGVIALGTNAGRGAENLCSAALCVYGTADSTCSNTLSCSNCNTGTELTNRYGITTTTRGTWGPSSCPTYETTATYSCSCQNKKTTYKCASGYYGTATSSSAGCTACPDNATCAGGNGSTFVCAVGYYKSGSACVQCPASGGVYGATSGTGATSITECCLPSGTSFSDTSGSGTYTGNCYYVN